MCNSRSLPETTKIVAFLLIAEQAIKAISEETCLLLSKKAIEACWIWLEKKDLYGDNLFYYLSNEESNDLVEQQATTKNRKDMDLLNCIINAVLFTSKKAYEFEGEKYYPQSIESIDNTLYNQTKQTLFKNNPEFKEIISSIEKKLPSFLLDDNKVINIKTLKELLR